MNDLRVAIHPALILLLSAAAACDAQPPAGMDTSGGSSGGTSSPTTVGGPGTSPTGPMTDASVDGTDTTEPATGSTTGSTTDSATGSGVDPTSSSSGEGSTSGSEGSESGAESSESGSESSESGSAGDDPAALPFGGYVEILTSYTPQTDYASFVGEANFYEPVAGSEPDPWEVPLGPPRDEDEWSSIFPLEYPANIPALLEPGQLDGDPQLTISGTGIEALIPYSVEESVWSDFVPQDGPYPGGPWTVDISADGDFAAAQLSDVIPGVTFEQSAFVISFSESGVPQKLTWTPLDEARSVVVTFFAFVGGDFLFPCYGRLVDDGEADFPAQCFDGLVPGEAMPGDALYIDGTHVFEADVAYEGRRLRVLYHSRTGLDEIPFPFSPE